MLFTVMAWTQADVDALQTAIAEGRGARQIAFGDQSVTFNSISEMLQLLAVMQQQVNSAASASRAFRVASVNKGV